MTSSTCAQPSTYGPITIPRAISITTPGRRVHRFAMSEMNGDSVAIDTINTRVRNSSGRIRRSVENTASADRWCAAAVQADDFDVTTVTGTVTLRSIRCGRS
jgi:hypothetical protein